MDRETSFLILIVAIVLLLIVFIRSHIIFKKRLKTFTNKKAPLETKEPTIEQKAFDIATSIPVDKWQEKENGFFTVHLGKKIDLSWFGWNKGGSLTIDGVIFIMSKAFINKNIKGIAALYMAIKVYHLYKQGMSEKKAKEKIINELTTDQKKSNEQKNSK